MKIIEKDVLTLEEKDSLMQLWNNEYPERLHLNTIEDFDLYLNGLVSTKHYLLIDDSNKIIGWTFTFLREDEKLVCNNFRSSNSRKRKWITFDE